MIVLKGSNTRDFSLAWSVSDLCFLKMGYVYTLCTQLNLYWFIIIFKVVECAHNESLIPQCADKNQRICIRYHFVVNTSHNIPKPPPKAISKLNHHDFLLKLLWYTYMFKYVLCLFFFEILRWFGHSLQGQALQAERFLFFFLGCGSQNFQILPASNHTGMQSP